METTPDWPRLLRLAIDDMNFWSREEWAERERARETIAGILGEPYESSWREPVTLMTLARGARIKIGLLRGVASGTLPVRPGSELERWLARVAALYAPQAACVACGVSPALIERGVTD